MRNYNEQRIFDLPLQTTSFLNCQIHHQPENRPKQLPNDQFRVCPPGKENNLNHCKSTSSKGDEQEENPLSFQSPVGKQDPRPFETAPSQKRNENLRNIIKKQLFSNDKLFSKKLAIVSPELPPQKQNSEAKPSNLYKQLLCEAYGQPKVTKTKSNKRITNINHPQEKPSSIKRHDSYKSLLTQKAKTSLHRHQSAASIRDGHQCEMGASSTKSESRPKPRELTYLQLYLQKRKPFLFL